MLMSQDLITNAVTATLSAMSLICTPQAPDVCTDQGALMAFMFDREHKGVIDSVAEDQASFTLRLEDDRTMSFSVNEETEYYLDGERSTKEKVLRKGNAVTVAEKEGVATKVEVKSDE